MAASIQSVVRAACRVTPAIFQRTRRIQTIQNGVRVLFVAPVVRQFFNSAKLTSDADKTGAAEALESHSRYKDTPWKYLESEEYIERYGSKPIWSDYRRNHKGGIPPQKTRKTCINVDLLQQFISPHTGMVYDSTRTGVCMKQQKLLNKAIEMARDHGFIPTQLPTVDYSEEDFSNAHGAVRRTPAPPSYTYDEPWYAWYGDIEPDERELARVKKIYKPYLK
ncbi:28S ribosomal protein S18b, mitochondrial [Bagarius yarrelli]|uniref:Small ribosomal subunit protein mS40 n=1 Tax=Bagarius yarrelli TaxID=175774 RepID=A0A556TNW5_BAGYA|nr:28S ribosomal protein S18b, mitochondrial [Bagarius yarrelli]